MNNEQHSGTTIRDLENQVYKVLRPHAKVLQFPKPVVDESPLRSAFDGMFAPIPKFVRASDAAIYNRFPSLSEMQCECEDCECKEHPTNFVETRYASFKLCQTCTDDCAKNVDKVVDLEALTDEQLCNDWELRR